jgi:hypothetical protein
MKNSERNKLIIIAVFAGAMGILEAIVAYYLRLLYYPGGFRFPLVMMPDTVLHVEIVREAATIVMLLTVALLTGKGKAGRVVLFLYMFGIWDILYYLGLKVLVGWPGSLLTWDLLFLIPLPWAAPVLAPVICSIFFIAAGVIFEYLQNRQKPISFGLREWAFLVSGAVLILYTFIADYSAVLYRAVSKTTSANSSISELIQNYTPERYRWGFFITGIAMFLAFLFSAILRVNGSHKKA